MDGGELDTSKRSLASFAFLVATLACLGIVPFLLWLSDQRILPYQQEWGWVRARQETLPLALLRRYSDSQVTLDRRGCEFMCPVYRVTINGSGKVDFDGFRYVCSRGHHTAQIDPRVALDLIHDLHVGGILEVAWETDPRWVDASTAVIAFRSGRAARTVEHYHGDHAAPRMLREMELAIDEAAGTNRWGRVYERHQFWCRKSDGSLQPAPPEWDRTD
jgi:hypothetical protein